MKKIFWLSLISLFFTTASAQVINVPGKAQKQFQEKYIGATNIKWTNSVVSYLASFKMNDVTCKAHYNIDGTWTYTEKLVKKDSFPEKVKDSFSKSKYRSWTIKSVAEVEYPDSENLYRYEVKNGMTKTYVFFNKEGELVKTN